jgi:3',5'-nucleoside bisphosphate phosphatase
MQPLLTVQNTSESICRRVNNSLKKDDHNLIDHKIKNGMANENLTHWIDLHLHSDKSDGTCSLAELISLAVSKEIKTISITDHDTIAGLKEGIKLGKEKKLNVIPGIEISSKYTKGALHILGYGLDFEDPEFKFALKRFQDVRKERNRKIISKLQSLGVDITMDEIIEKNPSNKSIGRPHIASVLLEKGAAINMDDAFAQYLGKNGKAFVSKEVLTSSETIHLIHSVGGLAFLAHPSTLNLSDQNLTEYVEKLLKEGLDGIEVYSSAHTARQTRLYESICQKYQLLVSGGSDFHGNHKKDVKMGICSRGQRISADMVSQELLNRAFEG